MLGQLYTLKSFGLPGW